MKSELISASGDDDDEFPDFDDDQIDLDEIGEELTEFEDEMESDSSQKKEIIAIKETAREASDTVVKTQIS